MKVEIKISDNEIQEITVEPTSTTKQLYEQAEKIQKIDPAKQEITLTIHGQSKPLNKDETMLSAISEFEDDVILDLAVKDKVQERTPDAPKKEFELPSFIKSLLPLGKSIGVFGVIACLSRFVTPLLPAPFKAYAGVCNALIGGVAGVCLNANKNLSLFENKRPATYSDLGNNVRSFVLGGIAAFFEQPGGSVNKLANTYLPNNAVGTGIKFVGEVVLLIGLDKIFNLGTGPENYRQ